jgi:hypothetical protein
MSEIIGTRVTRVADNSSLEDRTISQAGESVMILGVYASTFLAFTVNLQDANDNVFLTLRVAGNNMEKISTPFVCGDGVVIVPTAAAGFGSATVVWRPNV